MRELAATRFVYRFTPRQRIDVYHRAAERRGGAPVKIGEVLTDGIEGRVRALDPGFAPVLEALFTTTRVERSSAGARVRLAPWKRPTHDVLLAEVLARFDLRGERVELGTTAPTGARAPRPDRAPPAPRASGSPVR